MCEVSLGRHERDHYVYKGGLPWKQVSCERVLTVPWKWGRGGELRGGEGRGVALRVHLRCRSSVGVESGGAAH